MTDAFLSRFTPSLMTHEALEAVFVQREKLASRIVEVVRESALTPSKHHTLLIGPRGIGKTHLISVAYHRIRAMEDLHDRLLIAWMREEEWGVTSFLDLLLRIFRALEKDLDPEVRKRIDSLYQRSLEEAEHVAADLLREIAGDRTLLILTENLDDLFAGLEEHGQKQLRAYIQENPFITILATAQSLFSGVSRQTSPFYGTFAIHHLEGLNHGEATSMLGKMAELVEDRELAAFVRTPAGGNRIRAIRHLAGGNHRVYAIFSQFLTRDSLDQLVAPLMKTLDDLTAYYQSRMAYLPPQQRKIAEFLCDRRGAVSVKEIAEKCFLTHQGVSSQLKHLREKGYVANHSVGRDSYYELREPLMRLCVEVKKHLGEPIRLLVDFLRLWYTREELEQRMAGLNPEASLEREYVSRAIELSEEETEDPRVQASLADIEKYHAIGNHEKALEAAEELVAIRGNTEDWRMKGLSHLHLNQREEGFSSFSAALKKEPNDPELLSNWASFFVLFACYNEALETSTEILNLAPRDASAWNTRGLALIGLEHYEEALESFERALEFEKQDSCVWLNRAGLLRRLRRYEEALISFEEALEIHPRDGSIWSSHAWCLGLLGRFQEMLESSQKAVDLSPHQESGHLNCAIALFALNRWDEGCSQLTTAFALPGYPTDVDPEDAGMIARNLLVRTPEPSEWRTRARSLVEVFGKYEVLALLGQGVTKSITVLNSPMISRAAAKEWFAAWKDAAGDAPEFQIPLRLLEAAVDYREKPDPRILLRLPVEEREILRELLELEGETGE